MRDHADTEPPPQTYDLIVIGAGVAGLNALNSAAEYLPKGARVLLVDAKDRAGGMWNIAYDYVRLHQPHPMFTVGNMRWDWSKPRSYLAARDEVQAHLASALPAIGTRVNLDTAFATTVTDCAEVIAPDGPRGAVTLHPNDAPKAKRTLHAQQVIEARGLNYHLADPLPLETDSLHSIIPQDLHATLAAHPQADLIIVGGGKTAMDTVLATAKTDGQRPITLIEGRGTNFLNRTKYIPTGLERWTGGKLVSRMFRDLARIFDGTNEDALMTHVSRTYATEPEAGHGVFLFGLQSEDEQARISAALTRRIRGYLDTARDGTTGPELVLRSGETLPVPAGSIVVNCTGSFFRTPEPEPPAPLLSPAGTVMSINARAGMHFLTSVAGFFGPHLHARGLVRGQGFYTLDHEGLFRANRNAWV